MLYFKVQFGHSCWWSLLLCSSFEWDLKYAARAHLTVLDSSRDHTRCVCLPRPARVRGRRHLIYSARQHVSSDVKNAVVCFWIHAVFKSRDRFHQVLRECSRTPGALHIAGEEWTRCIKLWWCVTKTWCAGFLLLNVMHVRLHIFYMYPVVVIVFVPFVRATMIIHWVCIL